MTPAAPMPSPLYRYTIAKDTPAMTLLNHIDHDGDELKIDTYNGKAEIEARDHSDGETAIVHVDLDAAPGVALAILDAVGLVPDHPGAGQLAEGKLYAAAALLQEAVLDAAEEADGIDGEALHMLNAAFTSRGMTPLSSLPEPIADFWRAAAYAAREIHAHN